MLDLFSATVEKLYAAAAGDIPWKTALVAVEDLTGSAGAVIDLVPVAPDLPARTLAGSFSEENCAEYARDYQSICPRVRYSVAHPEQGTQFDYMFFSEADMDRDPVYHWFGTQGLRYHLGSPLVGTENYRTIFSLQRTKKQGHAQPADVRLFDLLKPHLARAMNLADQLGTLKSFDRFSSAVLEALPNALFALGRNGSVQFANIHARSILAAGDGLETKDSRLHATSADDDSKLCALVAAALHPAFDSSGGWARVTRPSGKPPYVIFVAPLAGQDNDLLTPDCGALAIVQDPGERPIVNAAVLRELYALTATEARLANALACGHSVESASAMLGMRIATARSHLKAIFAKTGVHRQQDLVRLLTSLSGLSL